MSFADFSAKFKTKRDDGAPEPEVRNFVEINALRGRILGVMIRDARQANGATQEETAAQLGITEEQIRAWEFGDEFPSLPQLEMLAYYLDVPLSQFWSEKTLDKTQEDRAIPVPKDQYTEIRDRLIGAKLTLARQGVKLSQEELAANSGLTAEDIANYESGVEIPFSHLMTLASATRKSVTYFIEDSGRVGSWLRLQEEYKRFSDMPDEMRAFVTQHANQAYIEIAMRLAGLPLGELRTVAEKILDITL